jgi:N-methylhydantoinase B
MSTVTTEFNAVLTAILANRVDSIVRDMTNTLLRSARSAVINSARDFSCAITTADNQLLACAEGLPVHIFGSQLQTTILTESHPDMKEGDAYLDNDPYGGGSHAADHTILVPVFIEGEHMFTAVAKAHQADIGNSIASTYHAEARDVYEEGALIFPTVQVQRDYADIDDVIRMCKSRIRVPAQWYGDYLAGIGAARVAEQGLKELCAKYGKNTVKQFVTDWLNYSEQRMAKAIEKLPSRRLTNTSRHDPFQPYLPDGVDINCTIHIDPADATIIVDLLDNPGALDCGLNMTKATTLAAVFTGLFNAFGNGEIPRNSGSFRRVDVRLRQGGAVGIPEFPHSCSLATTNLADRVINMVGSAFADLGAPYGISEAAVGMGPAMAVLSGKDPRYGGEAFVNQIFVQANGGPASATADGWVTYGLPVICGLMYRDSVEIDEVKMPIQYGEVSLIMDSSGAGTHRGGPAIRTSYKPKGTEVTVIFPCDGQETPPKGVLGGHDGQLASAWIVDSDGTEEKLPANATVILRPGQEIWGCDSSAGGYGYPHQRDPRSVAHDVREGWVSVEAAQEIYRVALNEDLSVDAAATAYLRSE